jgi:thiopeptide-type bacteriocin biosynthesis protein
MTEQSLRSADAPIKERFDADFAVLRVPLLPIEALLDWSEGMCAPAACTAGDAELGEALERDRATLRARLLELLADAQILAAIELASGDLREGIRRWRLDPGSRAGRSAERSLVRYLVRLASRPSPFGVAAGYALADLSGEPSLRVGPRRELRVVSRIDAGLLSTVVRDAAARARGDPGLLVRLNPLVYRTGSRLRVPAPGTRLDRPRLVALRPTPAIEAALVAARTEATAGAVLAAMGAAGASPQEAREQLDRLLDRAVLIPARLLDVTGAEPTAAAVRALRSIPGASETADTVERAARALAATPAGGDMAANTKQHLAALGAQASVRRIVQIDAIRTGELVLPRILISELARAIELLARVSPRQPDRLAEFRERFERRFATRAVPLLEALDPDHGVRFGALMRAPKPSESAGEERRATLLSLIGRAGAGSRAEIELTDADIAGLAGAGKARLPQSCHVICRLLARDLTALTAGEFTIAEPTVGGAGGANLVGRFCHGDDALTDRVRRHAEREALDRPDDIFAEIAVAPDTDWGLNVTHRPVLREWEIECGGSSGADPARRITPGDLRVSVVGGEVVLHSERLGRRVHPRLATALNPDWIALPAARFLAVLAHQEAVPLAWSWGQLGDAPDLPRIRRGRVILAERCWNVSRPELDEISPGTDPSGFRRLRAWRLLRGLPRFVSFEHPKNRLLVDFENVLSVEAFLAQAREPTAIRLAEAPGFAPAEPSQSSPVHGPEGRYAHELVVAFTRRDPATPGGKRRNGRAQATARHVAERERRFEPGSEWLFVKLYGPRSAFDRLLSGPIAELVAELRERRSTDRWFYVRYSDPDPHLRIRFHGAPQALLTDALPALHRTTAPFLDAGDIYRVCLDTYEREIERYGGVEGTELMEEVAQADSDAAVKMLATPLSLVDRRRLAAASVAALYEDCRLDLATRERLSAALRTGLLRDQPESPNTLLAAEERAERPALIAMLASLEDAEAPAPFDALRARSRALTPLLLRLSWLAERQLLAQPVEDIVSSYAHMAVNRRLLESGGIEELRVHDALARVYHGRRARVGITETTNHQDGEGAYA